MWKGAEKRLSRYSLADAEYVSSFGEGATITAQPSGGSGNAWG